MTHGSQRCQLSSEMVSELPGCHSCEDSIEVESLGHSEHGDGEDDDLRLEKTFSNESLEMFPSC